MKKTRRDFLKAAGTAAIGAGTVLSATRRGYAQTKPQFKWKAQCLWSLAETSYKGFEDLCKRIFAMTDGRLEITPFPSGSIVPNLECAEAVKNNVMQAAHQGPVYYSGKNPALAALGDLSIAWEHPWEADSYFHYGGGFELMGEIYKKLGILLVGVMWWGVESWPSKKPIRRMEDFKGLKIRVPQGMEADLLTRLGASVVVLPGTEIYSALDKGVVDATNWSVASDNDRLGYHKVAPYFTYPGFHSMPTGDFAVNPREWDRLPADIKAMFPSALRHWSWDVSERLTLEDLKVVSEAKAKNIFPVSWTAEEKTRIRGEAIKVWGDWKKKNEDTKKAIDSMEAFLRKLGRIS
jgi:TRAP-type mannitol/chloroaromatic compound transport system substrate-binding protein